MICNYMAMRAESLIRNPFIGYESTDRMTRTEARLRLGVRRIMTPINVALTTYAM